MSLQIKRGTNAQRLGIAFSEGELVFTTDTKKLYVGDGSTLGGIPVSSLEETDVTLGGDIDLNSNTILGIGNINIAGDIDLSGAITTASITTDTLVVNTTVASNLNVTGTFDIGSLESPWESLYVHNIYSQGVLFGEVEGNVRGADSTILVDSLNGTVPAENISGTFASINMGELITISGTITETSFINQTAHADITFTCQGTGTLKLNVPVQTTVGLPGAAAATPETPDTYIKIKVGNTPYLIPAYALPA